MTQSIVVEQRLQGRQILDICTTHDHEKSCQPGVSLQSFVGENPVRVLLTRTDDTLSCSCVKYKTEFDAPPSFCPAATVLLDNA